MKIEWLIVKGVCGFVHDVASTSDSWKTFACVMAASVVSNMLSNSLVFGDWASLRRYVYIFVKALVVSSKRSCNLLVFLGIEYRYVLMRT